MQVHTAASKSMHLTASLVVGLSGCAVTQPSVPGGYTGPTAVVIDSLFVERREKSQFFVLAAINGQPIKTAIDVSQQASAGMGSVINPLIHARDVPSIPLRVTLLGTHKSGALIAEIAYRAAGQFQSVEGETSLTPRPGVKYQVTGDLWPERSCVWIVDLDTKQPATEKICTVGRK